MKIYKKEEYLLTELINIESFKRILDNFYEATGIPNGLVGIAGDIITQSGWSDACCKFHRENIISNSYCYESNLILMENLTEGNISKILCKNGLIDYATPIVINNKIIATLFLGQVLHTAPNMEFFASQAEKFKYDKIKYLEAIKDIPIISEDKMKSLMKCIIEIIQALVNSTLSKLREDKLTQNLKKSSEQTVALKDILDFSPLGIGWSNEKGEIEYINYKFTELFGYTLEDIPTIEKWFEIAFPNKQYRNNFIIPWNNKVIESLEKGERTPTLEATVICKDKSNRRVLIRLSWIGKRRLANFSDITQHWKTELRNRTHDRMLGMVAKGASLSDILHNIVSTIELEDKTSFCSILLVDKDGKHLLNGASNSLPSFYIDAINGIKIGLGIGSCGTAAYLKERVIVEDIMKHEYWKDYVELAKKANIRSCWSEPILSSTGKVLGTFAIYHSTKLTPEIADYERISFAANLASIAIENNKVRKELEHRAYFDFLTDLPNRRHFIEQSEIELSRKLRYGGELSLIMFDIDHFKIFNDKYGHKVGDIVLQKVAEISRRVLRDIDIIGRIGGEEFAILLPQTNMTEALMVAERLRIEISKGKINLDKEKIGNFTASFGVVSDTNSKNIDELLVSVDKALYEAKNSGRNKVCSYNLV